MQTQILRLISLTCLIALAGCGSLPSSGPSISMIQEEADSATHPGKYVLVPVTQDILNKMQPRGSGASALSSQAPILHLGMTPTTDSTTTPSSDFGIQKITSGDEVEVSIYTPGGELFGPQNTGDGTMPSNSSSNAATVLPSQVIDNTGEITVPLVGRISVGGRTPYEVEQEITEGLKGKAFKPSVIVTILNRRGGDLVTVTGDVKNPSRVQIPLTGLRIIDAITAAGGIIGQDYQTSVSVFHGQIIRTNTYGNILGNPTENTFIQAGDMILVKTTYRSYTSMGATGQTLHDFPTEILMLDEALASVNGLDDEKANPEAVFVYRFEAPAYLKGLGVKHEPSTPLGVPVIYQIDLRTADGLFVAKQFAVHDKDVLFVGNAGTVGVMKTMRIVGALTSPFVTGASTATGVNTLSH